MPNKNEIALQHSKPVVVTGAGGFIGYAVAKRLIQNQVACIGVDYPDAFEKRAEHSDLKLGNIWNLEELLEPSRWSEKCFAGVIHMGACSDTTETRKDFIQKVNVEYSKSLWQLCRQHKVPFIYASSAATYGAGENGYADDENRISELKPLNLYGQSKQDFDLWALAEDREGRVPPAWSGFKFFNVYGFGERHKGRMASVVLQAFDQIRAQGSVKLFKSHKDGVRDGEQMRDFVFVEDVVDILLFALTKPIRRGIYNLGSGKARTFLDLVNAVFDALKMPRKISFVETPVDIRDKYQYFTEAHMAKIQAAGYVGKMTRLEDGVAQTVQQLSLQLESK